MTPILENEVRMCKDWRQMAITTEEHARYLKIARYLEGCHATSTWMVSRHLGDSCKNVRKDLRRMEVLGYVIADSKGSNNIYWSLMP